jgi:SnoaL-like domain
VDAASFTEYLEHFNSRRYDEMCTYYCDDVELELPASAPRGPEGIRDYYRRLHEHVREELRLDYLFSDGDRLACELYTEFHCVRDHPGFSFKPLVAGEVFRCTNFVHYDLEDDRFRRIRVGRYRVHS